MTTHEHQSADDAEESGRSTKRRVRSMLGKRRRDGSLALLAGTAMLAWAARTMRRSRAKAGLQALAGVTLVAVGRRQRLGKRREDQIETGVDADESASVDQPENEPTPRGMTDREDVEREESEESS